MPKQVIDKDMLLDKAYEIAVEDGLSSLSVRKLAGACGISVGSVYNYFPAMSDLSTAVIERFFSNAFYEEFCHPTEGEGFVEFARRLFVAMQKALAEFRSDWLTEISRLPTQTRIAGKADEAKHLDHIIHALKGVYAKDAAIDQHLPEALVADRLCPFVLSCMMSAIREHSDCEVLFALLERSLYGKTS